jgi:hypothetical protein
MSPSLSRSPNTQSHDQSMKPPLASLVPLEIELNDVVPLLTAMLSQRAGVSS